MRLVRAAATCPGGPGGAAAKAAAPAELLPPWLIAEYRMSQHVWQKCSQEQAAG